ncbi:MAG: serine/threonine-protein phosphatase, partial [Chloroflexi bacterium]|nr:serine/threonine-protein phosphatase [Chloroflexota bacterium]
MMKFIQQLFGKKTEPESAKTAPLVPPHTFSAEAQQAATAPLNMPAFAASNSPLRVAHAQSVGRMRDHNEDVLLTLTSTFDGDEKIPSFGLYIVADGMGGHSMGERASAVAARSVARDVTRRVYLSLLSDNSNDEERAPLQEVLGEALTHANLAVREAVGEGGTTGTAALVFNDQVIIGHVGDSRAYLITANGLEQLTRDHSLVRRLQELGQLTPAEAAIHPQRNVLYRAIGQGDGLEVDVYTQRLTPDTKILLCSDGLWGLVDDGQI